MLTVSEIAERIAKPGADKAALVERVRHWHREGLLHAIGPKRPGTGRHRQYPDDAVYLAAVLNVLADRGVQVGLMHVLVKLAKHHLEGGQSQGFLEIARFADGREGAFLNDVPRVNPNTESSLVLNLNQIFAGLKDGG
jgi:DNA-binding transcriptional MerR regulator